MGSWRVGFWHLADPKISLASFAGLLLGSCAAWRDGPLQLLWLGWTILAVFAIEVAKNASGEVFDYDSGTDQLVAPEDRSPFSGGKRVLVDALLTRVQAWQIAIAGYVMAAAIGVLIGLRHEPRIAWLGVAGLASAYFYHAPPLRLSYRGFGELAVALCYGPGIVVGTYLVQRGSAPAAIVLLSIPLGLLIAAFLLINEFPDGRADAACGKRNLVVLLGRKRASGLFAGLALAAMLVLCALPFVPGLALPRSLYLALPACLPLWAAGRTLLRHSGETARLIAAQVQTLRAFVLLSVLCGLALVLDRML